MVTKETRGWDNYWKRGALHSCISAADKDKQQEINDFWGGIYAQFPDEIASLDIGTGNGLLPSLAVTYANEQAYSWEIHGVDLANIDPVADVPEAKDLLDQINFQGRIAAEDLPFAAGYFDLVTAQYAIEYSDMARSIPEIARVLKKGGVFCAILHSHNSLVVAQNNENAQEADYLLESDIFRECKDLLSLMLSGKEAEGGIYNQYVENLVRLSESYPSPSSLNIIPVMQNSLMEIMKLSRKYRPQQILEMVDNARRRLSEQRDLLRDLVNSALDEAKLEELLVQLKSLNFDLVHEGRFSIGQEKGQENVMLGHYIQLKKR